MIIKDILDSMEALNKLNNAHGMSSVVAFRIGKNIKAIEGEVKVFDDVRTKLLEESANKDENGKPIIDKDTNQYDVPSDKLEALEKEIKKLQNEEVKVDIKKLKEIIPTLNLEADNTISYSKAKELFINSGMVEK